LCLASPIPSASYNRLDGSARHLHLCIHRRWEKRRELAGAKHIRQARLWHVRLGKSTILCRVVRAKRHRQALRRLNGKNRAATVPRFQISEKFDQPYSPRGDTGVPWLPPPGVTGGPSWHHTAAAGSLAPRGTARLRAGATAGNAIGAAQNRRGRNDEKQARVARVARVAFPAVESNRSQLPQ